MGLEDVGVFIFLGVAAGTSVSLELGFYSTDPWLSSGRGAEELEAGGHSPGTWTFAPLHAPPAGPILKLDEASAGRCAWDDCAVRAAP